MIRTQTRLRFSDARLTAGNRAPNLSPPLCCGALEPWRGSEYSPRPPESALKKSADLISDRESQLTPALDSTKAPQNRRSIDCFLAAERAFICFLKTLAQLLLRALKLTDWMIFYRYKIEAPNQSADLKKNNVELPTFWEQPNETYVH